MELSSDALRLDCPSATTRIKRFIKDYIDKSGVNGVVLGVSGGIDSSTTAALASSAIGGEKVLALSMPEEETFNTTDMKHIAKLSEKFEFELRTIDISPVLRGFYDSLPVYDAEGKKSKGNLKARTRMACLYYYANRLGRIVCGSSDKSETMIGYFTKWGDGAADISPILDLYKTQVRQLAEHLKVPNEIISKPSTPGLWPDHLAEEELGIKYDSLDLILLGLENFLSPEEIARQLELPFELVQGIKTRWQTNEHKRRIPLQVKLGYRTVGMDFRLPYTS